MTARAVQKEATREHLFARALRLFDERGYDAVNIDDIVRDAGVARGTFYFHFPKKEDLLLALIAKNDAQIVAQMAAGRRRGLRGVLRGTTDAFAAVWRNRRALLPHAGAVALRRVAEVESERERQPLRLALATHMQAAIDDGEVRARLPAQILADLFLLNVFAALMGWARTGEPAIELVMDGVIELFLNGAAPSAAPTHRDRPAARPARARRS